MTPPIEEGSRMIDVDGECRRLLDFARPAATTAGFAWLGADGAPDPEEPVHLWITTRMTYVFTLAHLTGEPGARELAEHGVGSLAGGPLRDRESGGWHASVTADGAPADRTKAAYAHAFVVLAAASAAAAGIDGAEELLADALAVVERHFVDAEGRVVDTLSPDLREDEDYRGANSSMHMVEALLAAADAMGEDRWRSRALAIAEHLVHDVARGSSYLLPEHFTRDWRPLPDYNVDRPADPFRPYGCTPGHLLEWARLLLTLEATTDDPPAWLLPDAAALFDRAVEVGWESDGNPGFVYTVDWDGAPVVPLRMHWVHAEALAAAAAFERRTGDARYGEMLRSFDRYSAEHLIDVTDGSWRHELDERSRPSSTVWRGKPDVYHAYQALLLTKLPYAPTLAALLASAAPA